MQVLGLVTSVLLVAVAASAAPSEQPASSSVPVASSPSQVEGPQPSAVVMEHPQHASGLVHQHQQHHHHQHQPGYYSPVVVGSPESAAVPVAVKPAVAPVSRNSEQYGQPESAGLPPNYKPFGSWGLYIGGNPADGYYTNYYKALSNSVDKQAVDSPVVKPGASPALRQAVVPSSSSYPYVGSDFYSYAYSPSDLNSALPVHHQPAFYGAPSVGSPMEPASSGPSSYSDFYATKKIGQAPVAGSKKEQRAYYYPYASPVQMSAPVAVGSQKPQQVVAYPVPVGSQIVGSQPGVDGSFDPYGVHAFTRYAVKPTVVSQADSTYYYSYPAGQQQVVPAYKQQQSVYSAPPTSGSAYSPFYGFYGYPMNQLHYSQGMIVPVQAEHGSSQSHHQAAAAAAAPAQPLAGEASSDKVEPVDQLKPQK